MTDNPELPRKKLRVGVTSERAAVNAVTTLFEGNRLVVQEYDTRNDYGKDLVVDLTDGDEITGTVIAVQVKGGISFFHGNKAFIPAGLKDIRLWADSTIPIIGIVWHPTTRLLHWVNLSEQCRVLQSAFRSQMPSPAHIEKIGVSRGLTNETLPHLVASMRVFAGSTSRDAYLDLLDDDDDVRRAGVFACWTYGRGDARALILLRRMLPWLEGQSFIDGVAALAPLSSNPDHFGHAGNWIPPAIDKAARQHLVWTADEVETMLHKHEVLGEGEGDGWHRGGTGQALWHLLNPLGVSGRPPFGEALRLAVERGHDDAAFHILVAIQWFADEPAAALASALGEYPDLMHDDRVSMLAEHVADWGFCEPYSA